jgi:hypothetical protein
MLVLMVYLTDIQLLADLILVLLCILPKVITHQGMSPVPRMLLHSGGTVVGRA